MKVTSAPMTTDHWLQMPGGVELRNFGRFWMVQRVHGQIHGLVEGIAEQTLLSDTDVPTAAGRMASLGQALLAYDFDQGGPPGFASWFGYTPKGPPNSQRLVQLSWLFGAKLTSELGGWQVAGGNFLIDYNLTEQQGNDLMTAIQACTMALPLAW